jgi:hypothetical protein
MSPEAQAIRDIIIQIKPEILWTLVQTSVIAIALMMFHKLWKQTAAYLSFRANKDLGKNVKIIIRGREAIITHFTIRFIFIRFIESGTELIIPITKWENQDWELIKNGIKK